MLGLADIYGVSKVQLGTDYLRRTGIDPAACVMVGDTDHDAAVAAAIGATCVLYTGGHQSRARLEAVCAHVIDDISQLPGCWKPFKKTEDKNRQRPRFAKSTGAVLFLEKMRQRDADGNDFTESSFKTPEKQGVGFDGSAGLVYHISVC